MDDNIQPVEQTTDATPSEDQTQVEEVDVATDVDEGSDAPESNPAEADAELPDEKRSPRVERRFQKMSQKMRELADTQPSYQQPVNQFVPQVEPGSEITPEQYQKDVMSAAQTITQLEINKLRAEQAQKEYVENFDRDVAYTESKYSELNADSPNYDSKLSEKVANMYEKLSAKNPNIRLRDIVDDVMEVAERKSTRATAQTNSQIKRQADESALKTTTTAKPAAKTAEEKSLAELEQELGYVS